MYGKSRYKFKVINGVLSWKNEEMERFMPLSAEILTRVILLYERELNNGIHIWKRMEEAEGPVDSDLHFAELTAWLDSLRGIFANIDPQKEKDNWFEDNIYLN